MAAIVFILFNVLAIQMPGLLLYKYLIKKEYSPEFKLLASYFLGMMLLFVEYLVESQLEMPGFTLVASVIFVALCIASFIVDKRAGKSEEMWKSIRIEKFTWLLFGLVFVFSFVNFTYPYMFAKSAQSVQVYHDILFHTGNITSLSRGFFNDDIRVYGLTFYYHFFYDLIYGICKHITKVDAYDLLIQGTPFVSAWWMALAMSVCGKRIDFDASGIRKLGIYGSSMFAGLLMYPILIKGFHFPLSGVTEQVTDNTNALGMGVALGVVIIEIMANGWKTRLTRGQIIAVVILFGALTGAKGPVAAVLLATLFVVFVAEGLINKKFNGSVCLTLVLSSLVFALVYKVVDTGIGVSEQNANRAMTLSPVGTLGTTRVTQFLEYIGFTESQYTKGGLLVVALILLTITIVGPCILGFIGYVVLCTRELIKNKKVDNVYDWIAIGGSLIGIGGVLFIDIPGFSQQYCLIGVAPLYAYCVVRYVQRGHVAGLVKLSEAMLLFGMLCFVVDIAHNTYEGYFQNMTYNYPYEDEPGRVSALEMEGFEWLKNNTSEDCVIAYDRHTEDLDYRNIFFYCSAFSERQIFIEGYHYSNVSDETAEEMLDVNKSFYGMSEDVPITFMGENNIQYVVVSRVASKLYWYMWDYEKVFSNDDIAIYSVNY